MQYLCFTIIFYRSTINTEYIAKMKSLNIYNAYMSHKQDKTSTALLIPYHQSLLLKFMISSDIFIP